MGESNSDERHADSSTKVVTNFVYHDIRNMKKRNVTVVLGDESARWLRVEAARNDTSVSKYLGALVDQARDRASGYDDAQARFLAKKPRRLGIEGCELRQELPRRDEVHDRTEGARPSDGSHLNDI